MRHNYVKHRDSAGDLEYFVSKFECRVEDSREYNQYVRPAPYYRDVCASDDWRMETKILPMKAIHLTSDNLARLVAEQELMQRQNDDLIRLSVADEQHKRMWTQMHEDKRVRDSNPAVKKAYQKYVMLLELARK
jgi:hypothetical protein